MEKYKKFFKKISINIIICICIFSTVYTYVYTVENGYKYLYLFPITYLLVYLLIYHKIIYKKMNIFLLIFLIISFIRYVISPILIVYSSHYGGRSLLIPLASSYKKAIFLMIYELAVSSIYVYILDKKIKKPESKINFIKKDNWYFILILILTILIIIFDKTILKSLSFIIPTATQKIEELSFKSAIILNLFMIIKHVVTCNLLLILFEKYKIKKRKWMILLSLFLIVVDISIYMGTNRSKIILPFVIYCVLLYKFYNQIILKYLVLLFVLVGFILVSVGSYREYAIVSENKVIAIADKVQVYTGGVYNVAIAIETKEFYPEVKKISTLFFDIFRPMVGINFFVKNLPFNYSNIYFNKRIWLEVDRRSQIIPILGQGYIFFGSTFSPLLLLLFLKLAYKINTFANKSTNIATYFILNLILARIGFIMGQNTMNMINYISILLFIYIIILLFRKLLYKISKKGSKIIEKNN